MIGVVVVTHSRLAEELVEATRRIVGEAAQLHAVSIDWNDDVEKARKLIQEGIKKVDNGEGVLILTDMFGGTPTNISLTFLEKGRVEIVTGVNLPMLIKYTTLKDLGNLEDLASRLKEQGMKSIHVASELLKSRN
ncbi:MAG: PTS sugar transporter subunit IIA [Acidobacteriota bacterium]